MGVFRRVSDIISANVNDLVEKFETPEVMLRLAIREMDAALSRTTGAAARAIADGRMLDLQLEAQKCESADLHRRACEALRCGDEPAARRALSRHNDCKKLIAALDDQQTAARSAASRLRRQLDAMRVRRSEAEYKLHLVRARQQAAEARRHLIGGALNDGEPEAGFSRFDRVCRTIDRLEAETDAYQELTGAADETAPADAEFEAQFAALKREYPATPGPGHHGTV
jgi:phage shock protein A